jgi:dihydrodipicolinate synthase/N-acetylneuraminate lyase
MSVKKKYTGVIVPLATPLTENFGLDHAALERIFDHIGQHGCQPFILGTTGEASWLPQSIKLELIEKAGSLKKPGQQLYAGITCRYFDETVDLALHCFSAGVDVVVITLPPVFEGGDLQMLNYFERFADVMPCPVIIYNIPAITPMSVPLKVIDKLSHHPNIAGVKDSERDDERLDQSISLWSQRNDFSYLLGWAARSAPALFKGADGIVPSTANVQPSLYAELGRAVENSDRQKANFLQDRSDRIGNLYQSGRTLAQSLAALKVLMKHEGLCDINMMPPNDKVSAEEEKKLRQAYNEIIS